MSEDHAGFSISTALSGPRANIDKTMGTVSIDIFCASIRKQQTIAKGDANPAFEISIRHPQPVRIASATTGVVSTDISRLPTREINSFPRQ